MFEKALIDGDIVTYRCAAANENQDVNIACWQAGEMIRRILHETNSISPHVFLSGSSNFRYTIYPEYKANRAHLQKPRHYSAVREYLCTQWNSSVTDGYEADDAMGMAQDETTIICSIDKDMLMIPGWHYNFVKQEQRYVSPLDGLRHFYYQLIMGDKADNIPGYDGKMRDKVPKFMRGFVDHIFTLTEEIDMYEYVHYMYEFEIERLNTNGKCLWIWRKDGDIWIPPNERMDRGTEEGIYYLSDTGGLTPLAPEIRDSEGSLHREEEE